jgi:hypothetical protein
MDQKWDSWRWYDICAWLGWVEKLQRQQQFLETFFHEYYVIIWRKEILK